MKLTSLKQLLAVAGLILGIAGGATLLTGAAVVMVRAGTGADPADAFNPTDLIPESLRGTVTWLDDPADLDREMEPTTRTALEAAWLRAAAGRELAPDGPEPATDHELTVDFYSLDGQIVGLTATSLVAHRVGGAGGDAGGESVQLHESYEAVVMLTDGRWELDQLVRVGAELATENAAVTSS